MGSRSTQCFGSIFFFRFGIEAFPGGTPGSGSLRGHSFFEGKETMTFRTPTAALAAALILASFGAGAMHEYSSEDGYAYRVVRHGVMISGDMLPGEDGLNINGPAVIRAPAWLKDAPGKYLMYFAHHTGEYIRLAYAEKLTGPWKVYEGGIFHIRDGAENGLSWNPSHIASPEIFVDEAKREIRMYFHTPVTPAPKFDDPDYDKKVLREKQETFLAVSTDGIHFRTNGMALGDHYMRVIPSENGGMWGFSRLGQLNFSHNGLWRFQKLSPGPIEKAPVTFAQMRHPSLLPVEGGVLMFYSKIADTPESILVTRISMKGEDWTEWKAEPPKLVLTVEEPWEGADLPRTPGKFGSSAREERGLRDPYVIVDEGKMYLFYTVKGEKGIALAELSEK